MKIIHCADLHLGSKMRAKLPEEKAEERRGEVREALEKMLRYAKENGAEAVLISGDAFDSDRPAMRDKQLFYRAVAAHKELMRTAAVLKGADTTSAAKKVLFC